MSGLRPASLVPTMVMTLLRASLRLFTASSTTAIEFENIPTAALKAAKRMLAMMPMTLVRMITWLRSACCPSTVLFLHIFSAAYGRKASQNGKKSGAVSSPRRGEETAQCFSGLNWGEAAREIL